MRRESLGRQIRSVRAAAGIPQRELALMVSTNQSYLWEVETGRVSVGLDVLCRMADALDAKVCDLIDF